MFVNMMVTNAHSDERQVRRRAAELPFLLDLDVFKMDPEDKTD